MSFSSPLPLIVTGGLGSFTGPALRAFVIMGVTEGREGIGRLLRKIVLRRVGLGWYLFALVGLLPGNLAWASSVASPEDSSSMEFRIYYKRLPAYQSRERTTDLSPPRS